MEGYLISTLLAKEEEGWAIGKLPKAHGAKGPQKSTVHCDYTLQESQRMHLHIHTAQLLTLSRGTIVNEGINLCRVANEDTFSEVENME